MFDLNDKEFNGTVVFNNGTGGKVEGVTITVEKKSPETPDTYPAYKLVVDDGKGGKINQGFYYPKNDASKSPEQNEKRARTEVSRIVQLAKAVLGKEAILPTAASAIEAFDKIFAIVQTEGPKGKFNVFATYGTIGYPSQYLNLRYFDYIENINEPTNRLVAKPADLLERVAQDEAPKDDLSALDTPQAGGTTASPVQNWTS